MKSGSIKFKLYMILAFVVLLLLLVVLNLYLQYTENTLEQQISNAARIEKDFLVITHDEHFVIRGYREDTEKIVRQYDLFRKQFASFAGQSREGVELIDQRRNIFQNFIRTNKESASLFQTAHDSLDDLVDSVRFIHRFHNIVHLKNIAARGAMGELEIIEEAFERSPVQGASEVEIIESAVDIQGYLLEIFNTFEGMQRGHETSEVETAFAENFIMVHLAVNQFEDYSLDAQDGLLVEELLLNCGVIKGLFDSPLNNKNKMQELTKQLNTNDQQIVTRISMLIEALNRKTSATRVIIKVLQTLSLLVTLVVVVGIIVSGRRIIKGLTRTVEETEKIQQDLSYRISGGRSYFNEFGIVFQALNNMAGQIHEKMRELQTAHDTLEARVQERTKELEEKNRDIIEGHKKVAVYSKIQRNEMERGRQIQTSFFPGELPGIDGWELNPFFKPARQVAGDFYDIFKLPDGCIGIVVADVCDKGVGAALFMALFRSLIRIFYRQNHA